jgi:hypothetical protein
VIYLVLSDASANKIVGSKCDFAKGTLGWVQEEDQRLINKKRRDRYVNKPFAAQALIIVQSQRSIQDKVFRK